MTWSLAGSKKYLQPLAPEHLKARLSGSSSLADSCRSQGEVDGASDPLVDLTVHVEHVIEVEDNHLGLLAEGRGTSLGFWSRNSRTWSRHSCSGVPYRLPSPSQGFLTHARGVGLGGRLWRARTGADPGSERRVAVAPTRPPFA